MDDTLSTNHASSVENQQPPVLPAPQGIGIAVVFDWALAAQLLVGPLLPLFIKDSAATPTPPTMNSIEISLLSALPFALIIAIFGEGIRRGWRWTRLIQIVFNAFGILVGILSLFTFYESARYGNYWPLVTSVILVVFSPLIVWGLSRPQTASWFSQVSSSDARRLHGGIWPFFIALCALVSGTLQAIAAYHR